MKSKLLISVAAGALLAGTCLAAAQGAGPAPAAKEGPAPAAKAAPAAPAAKGGPMTRGEGPAMNGPAAGPSAQKAPEAAPRGNQAEQRTPDANPARRADDNNRDDMKSKAAEKPNADKADDKSAADSQRDKGDAKRADDNKNGPDNSRTTTGQAGAGAKLTSEQRTTVRAAIDKQHVRPATNINFSISIGTRVPRTVEFYPVPTELVTVYPDWRGYEYFLVGDQIIIVNPRTDEIVAVVDA